MINYNSLLLLLLTFISTYTFPNEGSPLIGQTHKKNIISNEENEDIGAYDINYGSDADVFSGETHNFFLECNELTEDRVVLGINEQIDVGGTVWYDDNQDGVFNFPTENGIGSVEVYLIDVQTGVPIVVTFTDFADGSYLFEDIDSGEYIILVTGSNFMGGPLNYNESSIGQADADNDVDDDDNGDDDVTDGCESTPFFLTYGGEPGPDGSVNTTIDFGFWTDSDCYGTLSKASCELLDEFDLIFDLNMLNEYCAIMPPPPLVGPAPNPLCPTGSSPHNMSWFSFVADTINYTIDVVPNNCQPAPNGQIGVQAGIYTDCTFGEAVICNPDCSVDPIQLHTFFLISGETYYFFLDGCNGSVCDYTIYITVYNFIANATSTPETSYEGGGGTVTCMPNGSDFYQFAWNNGDTTQEIINLMPGDYIVTVNDELLNMQAIDTITVEAYICDTIMLESNYTNNACFEICDGSITILNVDNATSPITYVWDTGENTASLSNLCVGEYIVTITDAKNCSVSDTFTISQREEIIITIDSTGDLRPDSLGYIAITTNNYGNYIFDWSGPSNFTAETEDLNSLSDFGCYTLIVTNTNTNCSVDTTICIDDLTTVYDLEMSYINMYPNPTKDNFIIDFRDTKIAEAAIILYDLSGNQQMVLEKQANNQMISVNAEMLNSGLYLIKFHSEKYGTFYKKLVLLK